MTPGRPPTVTIEERRSNDAARSQARYERAHTVIRTVRLDARQATALDRRIKSTGLNASDVVRALLVEEAARLRRTEAHEDPFHARKIRGPIARVLGNITLDKTQAADLNLIRKRTGENTTNLVRRLLEGL